MLKSITLAGIAFLLINHASAQEKNLAAGRSAFANSASEKYPAKLAVDGVISRQSKWMSASAQPPHILEINLGRYCNLSKIVVHTGIPESEKTQAESGQAAGFWSAKNFKVQYWDDANWTDLPHAEVHENRLDDVAFEFSPAINTYQFRIVCDDGEAISINEVQAFGTETDRLAPNTARQQKATLRSNAPVTIRVEKEVIGKSMKYVGYNQGYYMPGSNASGWIEYSGVNSLRVWTSLNSYVPVAAVEVDKTVATMEEFDRRKSLLRQAPEKNAYLQWDKLLPLYNATEKAVSTNPMVLNYVLSELKRLKIEPLLQINNTDFNETWSNKWQQWQRFYALAFYAAKTGDATMFAMQNEPNHRASGPMKLDQWISAMQIVSDAIKCALEDVNKLYNKNLKPRMVGPVTAGNNQEWWTAVAKNLRTDYHGKPIDENLLGIFSTHSYNSPAAGYAHRIEDIRKILSGSPGGATLPIVYTEIGRWMNAYLIDKEETMDSPTLFTEWAGIYANNTLNKGYGMWAFKFSNTSSETYPGGVKSGHHFTWQGKRIVEDAYRNLLKGRPAREIGSLASLPQITDGIKSSKSVWISAKNDGEKILEIDLQNSDTLGSAVIYTGSDGGEYTAPDRVKNFRLQYLQQGSWKDIPGTVEKNNRYAQVFQIFDKPVFTSKLRFISSDSGSIKVREIKAFSASDGLAKNQDNYDVSGIQRTGEVVRLFAKGFKDERPLLKTSVINDDEDIDLLFSHDSISKNYYCWLVQRGARARNITLDLSALKLPTGSLLTAETVSPGYYGEVTMQKRLMPSANTAITLKGHSVTLLTIANGAMKSATILPSRAMTVSGGNNNSKQLTVSLDSGEPARNNVTYLEFKPGKQPVRHALLHVNGLTDQQEHAFRCHVYAIPGGLPAEDLTWPNAPLLDSREAYLHEVGQKAFVAGEIAFTKTMQMHTLDVTDIIRRHGSEAISFVIIRETRQIGDDIDKGKKVLIGDGKQSFASLSVFY